MENAFHFNKNTFSLDYIFFDTSIERVFYNKKYTVVPCPSFGYFYKNRIWNNEGTWTWKVMINY